MDEIRIDNLEVFAHHGVFPEETEQGQKFYINAVLYTDTRQAGLTDELEKSVDYGEICHLITDYMQQHTWKLLERVAEMTVAELLEKYPSVSGMDLEVRKPEAPIGLPFSSVSVKIHRQWHRAYVAFGSNLGNREEHIRAGIDYLKGHREIRVLQESGHELTEPYGDAAQYEFVNGVLELDTYLKPAELLEVLHEAELKRGRTREIHWGPRTLDLDIILYDDWIVSEKDLVIPHKDMKNRDFVLKPMAEVAPYVMHPVYRQSMEQMWQEFYEKRTTKL